MSIRVMDAMFRNLGQLRHEPTDKRIRATLGDQTVVDTTRAMLVWEPRRIVPSYAVPIDAVAGELVTENGGSDDADGPPVLSPKVPFAVHTADGESVGLRVDGETKEAVGFRLADPDLDDYVILDFNAFDKWYEEDEQNVGHPRNPFHRIDILHSSRHVRVELDGEVLAETTRPLLLFETSLPMRVYMPREDVRAELRPSTKRSYCAYKGHASYWSLDAGGVGRENLIWSYEEPLREAAEITGLVSFFNEKVDIVVEGERSERPQTEWS
jgi:uncharacterized protein (DUF427 family)